MAPTLIQLAVDSLAQIGRLVGPAGLFVPEVGPLPIGAEVWVEFVDGAGVRLSRIVCQVVPPPAEASALGPGVALEVRELDTAAQAVLKRTAAHSQRNTSAALQPELLTSFFVEETVGPVLGIDLGTTFSCVAVVDGDQPRVLRSPEGYETVPSVVYLTPERKLIVGQRALEKMTLDPARAIYGAKRFIGRPYSEAEARTYGHFFRYQLVADRQGRMAARIDNQVISLEVVAAAVLGQLRQIAQASLGQPVRRAVITVPAYFGEAQRQATVRAAVLAGLEVERLLNEPTAGAVAYGFGRGLNQTILVYDLGGGTFDASVLRVEGDRIRVLATDGGSFLGGADFDDRLTEYLASRIAKEHEVDLRANPVAMQRLRAAAEKAKRQLSEAPVVAVDLPYLISGGTGQLSVNLAIEQRFFEELTADLVDRTMTIVQAVLDAAAVTTATLDDVVMIGGQSRAPAIRRLLNERFGRQPTRKVHPDLAVALGAAIVAAARSRATPVELTDVLPASIRLGFANGVSQEVLRRGSQLPVMTHVEVTADERSEARVELYRGEAVASKDNELLGTICLPAVPAGTRAQVSLLVNGEGLLSVSAVHPETQVEHELEIALLAAQSEAPVGDSYFEM